MPGLASTTVNSPIGPVGVVCSPAGVRRVSFGPLPDADVPPGPASPDAAAHLASVCRELTEFFAGARTRFDTPVDWSLSDGWPLTVRRRLFEAVGYGETVSYGGLAALAGRPDGARAVGGIMAGNPVPVVVPCHRVVAADGGIGGFAGSGGRMVETKRRLLELEGSAPPTLF
ncbi:methylated-DNA-[protein]-cysteine S-methyltransferase [Stackebrandtia albiflava]|uniref:Methylated-DNA--protein-cysteine methyltransferase n=1 Tax=Stackebrandtia albiflava TaxID=406432 RepID=A0A562VC53_9ACTN|nr:methylated-DNA--[protein]-cysteine S-methyltransferase [Stackebrandtia albiflava]TWJ15438.1 methylated-DNA-[protein]-cysteine S-methyltransferase [Stackebrandtia albiflava]